MVGFKPFFNPKYFCQILAIISTASFLSETTIFQMDNGYVMDT